ncbi:uncharacterized protein SPSK_03732 [Sporothrix schenckii 1099-18]|nr:uncharacterized protein SPSK_03732 [Sporothrix schenckii 1099-18]KJR81952.1 hypothetical protein SPSK_03732 [Sporothrix schenckii 1099-18]
MLVISCGGERLFSKAAKPMPGSITSLVSSLWFRLRQLGVDHGDEREPNLLWNARERQLVCIDFEWAKIADRKQEEERRREQRWEWKRKHTAEMHRAGGGRHRWTTALASRSSLREGGHRRGRYRR